MLVDVTPLAHGHLPVGQHAGREIVDRVRRNAADVPAVRVHRVEHGDGKGIVTQDDALAAGRDKGDAAVGQVARVHVVVRRIGDPAEVLSVHAALVDQVRLGRSRLVREEQPLGVPREIGVAVDPVRLEFRRQAGELPVRPNRRERKDAAARLVAVAAVEMDRVDVGGVVGQPLGQQQLVEALPRTGRVMDERVAQGHAILQLVGIHVQLVKASPLRLRVGLAQQRLGGRGDLSRLGLFFRQQVGSDAGHRAEIVDQLGDVREHLPQSRRRQGQRFAFRPLGVDLHAEVGHPVRRFVATERGDLEQFVARRIARVGIAGGGPGAGDFGVHVVFPAAHQRVFQNPVSARRRQRDGVVRLHVVVRVGRLQRVAAHEAFSIGLTRGRFLLLRRAAIHLPVLREGGGRLEPQRTDMRDAGFAEQLHRVLAGGDLHRALPEPLGVVRVPIARHVGEAANQRLTVQRNLDGTRRLRRVESMDGVLARDGELQIVLGRVGHHAAVDNARVLARVTPRHAARVHVAAVEPVAADGKAVGERPADRQRAQAEEERHPQRNGPEESHGRGHSVVS